MNRFVRLLLKIARGLLIVTVTLFVVWAFDARHMPELELWHTTELSSEFKAGDKRAGMMLADFLRLEGSLLSSNPTTVC